MQDVRQAEYNIHGVDCQQTTTSCQTPPHGLYAKCFLTLAIVLAQAGELKSRIAAFAARWEDLKPKGVPTGDPALILIKTQEYSKQLVDLQVNIRLPVILPYHLGQRLAWLQYCGVMHAAK